MDPVGDPPQRNTGLTLNFNATARSLADSYWPAFGALLSSSAPAPADGVMMAMAALNGVSTTVSPLLLQTMLREAWNSTAIVQTDCCDSVTWTYAYERHRNASFTQTDAIARFIAMGGGAYFGFDGNTYKPLVEAALANGTISSQSMVEVGTRVLETEMKLGFYDQVSYVHILSTS